MRIDIDATVNHDAALARANGRKVVGRKHNHQPRGRAIERRKAAKRRALAQAELLRHKFSLRVAAYWRGEMENYPNGLR